jgi:hypothetical protein
VKYWIRIRIETIADPKECKKKKHFLQLSAIILKHILHVENISIGTPILVYLECFGTAMTSLEPRSTRLLLASSQPGGPARPSSARGSATSLKGSAQRYRYFVKG